MALHSTARDLTAASLCTGGGALDLALELAIPALRPVLYVEREAIAAAHLVSAFETGLLPPAPLWSDARSAPGRRFRGCVDFVFGGIPCQPHSEAGPQRGADDDRDLWPAARRFIVQSGAWSVFIENVGGIIATGGAYRIFRDLRRLGFEVEGGLFSAEEVGFNHERERFFILATRAPVRRKPEPLADADRARPPQRSRQPRDPRQELQALVGSRWPMGHADRRGHRGRAPEPERGPEGRASIAWTSQGALSPAPPWDRDTWSRALVLRPHLEPVVRGASDGLATGLYSPDPWTRFAQTLRLDRLRLLGNGVVPLEAAYAFRTLSLALAARSTGAARLVRMTAHDRAA